MKRILSFCIVFFCVVQLSGQEIRLNGFADTYHAARVHSPYDFLSSRTRFRAEIRGRKDNSSFFVSTNAIHNTFLPELTEVELREAYVDYSIENFSFRAGRQIITFGQADGLWITDLISPWDFTEFLARDFDDIRIPVNALKFKFNKGNYSNELMYVLQYEPFIFAPPGSPWAFTGGIPENVPTELLEPNEPALNFKNGEWAYRGTLFSSFADISIVAMYTWNKLPVFQITPNDTGLTVSPKIDRLLVTGFDFSTTVGPLVIRGEAALYFNELYQSMSQPEMDKRNSMNAFVGGDWFPAGGWMLSGQLYNKTILQYTSDIISKKNATMVSFMVSKSLIRNTITLSSMGFYDIDNESMFSRSSIAYSLSDPINVSLGFDGFVGEKGQFGQFHDNDEIWMRVKYSF